MRPEEIERLQNENKLLREENRRNVEQAARQLALLQWAYTIIKQEAPGFELWPKAYIEEIQRIT